MVSLFETTQERSKREANTRELHDILWRDPLPVARVCAIIKEQPQAARHTDVYEQTPLHVACTRGGKAPMSILQALVEAWPGALRAVTAELDTPLHLACTRQAPYCILNYLVEQDPRTLYLHNMRNERPLHILVRGADASALPSVKMMIDKGPKALSTKNRSRDTPLHVACSRGKLCAKLIRTLLAAYPEAAAMPNCRGDVPLHCVAGASAQHGLTHIWDLLVESYPESVYTTNIKGQTPIHIAATRTHHTPTDAASLYTLWQSHPAVLLMGDKDGNTPLHVACQSGAAPEIIRILGLAAPKALTQRNDAGDTPVHVLCQAASSTHVRPMESCVVTSPGASPSNQQQRETSSSTMSLGATSIMSRFTHTALSPNVERILSLVQVSPKVLRKTNKQRQLPLHAALQGKNPSIPLLRYLVDEYPEALRHVDKEGRLPVHVACSQHNVSYTAVQMLVNGWTMMSTSRTGTNEFLDDEDEDEGDTSSSSDSQRGCPQRTTPERSVSAQAWNPSRAPPPRSASHQVSSSSPRRSHHHRQYRIRSGSIGESHGLLETTIRGDTPLHLACQHNLDFDIIQFLVHHGPGAIYVPNEDGRTPLDVARKYGTSKEIKAWVKRMDSTRI